MQLALELVAEPGLLGCRPSLAAAAMLAVGRAACGVVPFWPSALEVPPGYYDARLDSRGRAASCEHP